MSVKGGFEAIQNHGDPGNTVSPLSTIVVPVSIAICPLLPKALPEQRRQAGQAAPNTTVSSRNTFPGGSRSLQTSSHMRDGRDALAFRAGTRTESWSWGRLWLMLPCPGPSALTSASSTQNEPLGLKPSTLRGNPRLCLSVCLKRNRPHPEPCSSIPPLSTPPSPHFTSWACSWSVSLFNGWSEGGRRQKHQRSFIYLNKCSIARFVTCHLRTLPLGSHSWLLFLLSILYIS